MTDPALPGPPPMPSILASGVAELFEAVAVGRRALALLIGRL